MFIDVEVDAAGRRTTPALAKKLDRGLPGQHLRAGRTTARCAIVEENLDECTLCELCIQAAPGRRAGRQALRDRVREVSMRTIAGMLAATLLFGGAALAVDDPDELMTGNVHDHQDREAREVLGQAHLGHRVRCSPSATNAPTSGGGSLQIFDTGKVGNERHLQPARRAAGRGSRRTPRSRSRASYKGAGTSSDPCKSVIVKGKVVKANCKGVGRPARRHPSPATSASSSRSVPTRSATAPSFGGSGKNEPRPRG